jgi:hypothetical protein
VVNLPKLAINAIPNQLSEAIMRLKLPLPVIHTKFRNNDEYNMIIYENVVVKNVCIDLKTTSLMQ